MQVIKPVLILCFVILLVVVFRHRATTGLRAGSRVAALLLGVAAIASVADPDILQWLAGVLGVVRGTDLLLYALVVVFALTAMAFYFQQREARVELQKLARRVALSEAVQIDGPPGRRSSDPAGAIPAAVIPAGERLIEVDATPVPVLDDPDRTRRADTELVDPGPVREPSSADRHGDR